MPRKLTTVVQLELQTGDPAAWRRADEVVAAIGAAAGVRSVEIKNRSDHYMDLHLSVHLSAPSKTGLRAAYSKVSRIADASVLRLAARSCKLDDLF